MIAHHLTARSARVAKHHPGMVVKHLTRRRSLITVDPRSIFVNRQAGAQRNNDNAIIQGFERSAGTRFIGRVRGCQCAVATGRAAADRTDSAVDADRADGADDAGRAATGRADHISG